jgi:glucose-1-phosphate cytidylyltransferase
MKVVIFAGGIGSRISEESHLKPKPMIEIGGKPILWHIMKIYEKQGFNEFIICLGYKGYMIKEYFLNYFMHNSDVTIDLQNNQIEVHKTDTNSFKVTLVDTGLHTKTAGRLKRVKKYLGDNTFMLTYGDGLTDINLKELIAIHKKNKKIVTMTAVQPEGRFGAIETDEKGIVKIFHEKPQGDGNWINGGFFVVNKEVFNYLDENADEQMWEDMPLENLTKDNELATYKHFGFWRCMDALRDKVILEDLWNSNKAKWKNW